MERRFCGASHSDGDYTEEDESFRVTLSSESDFVLLENDTIIVTILDAEGIG